MNVVVVYTWARDPQDAAVRSDGSVDWRGARMAAGDDDHAAIAVARAIAAAAGCDLIGLTIGDGDASWALARGVEQAVSVPDAPSLADHAATAAVLAAAVRWIGDVGVVVIGDAEAYPGVAAALAGGLGWPAVLAASTADVTEGRLRVSRCIDGRPQTLSLGLPAVVAVAAASAEKQPPGMKEVLAARRRPVTTVPVAGLGVDPVDRVASRAVRVPAGGSGRRFGGSPSAAAAELVAALRADGLLPGRGAEARDGR
jgi:electron transfer flavoprotein beta subunit